MPKAEWLKREGALPWLRAGDPTAVERLLRPLGALEGNERVIQAEKAGEGNMNLVLRVTIMGGEGGRQRSVIVKQSRPWVEKYDHIDAPWDRCNVEAAFYLRVAPIKAVASRMPRLLAADAAHRMLVLEDLGPASDHTCAYAGASIEPDDLATLGGWLRALHDAEEAGLNPALANREMRLLNHAHIFIIPLEAEVAPNLERIAPGLSSAAARLRDDGKYREVVRDAGRRYLADGTCLLHGDYFPGSWLRTARGPFIIDPEFCFCGDREFDAGVALAHFALAARPVTDAARFLSAYGTDRLGSGDLAVTAGIEVMRRLIGVAQLPLPAGFDRAGLLRRSRQAVVKRDWRQLWSD